MPEYYEELFERYRTRGLLLDANLLVLHVVGSHDERLVESFKRTKVFTRNDFRLLARIVGFFARLERAVLARFRLHPNFSNRL